MIKVWTDGVEAGILERGAGRSSTFAYQFNTVPAQAVSLTMPIRLASWTSPYGLTPIFEMNLPEGALRERLRLAFAKATGTFDDLELLTIVGRSQMGRIRYTGLEDDISEEVPFQSVDEILASRRDGELFRYLLERFAIYSGVSGVQPKVLIRDTHAFTKLSRKHHRLSQSFKGATHIVKFWETTEFPQLAANEYFCLKAAERCGLVVPAFGLAENGAAIVIERFDIGEEGRYLGFEDFCVLNALHIDEKYRGSYETSILKRFHDFSSPSNVREDMERLFTLIALNCALRNGDAHLKNFGVLYNDIQGEVYLAPVYDLVTTAVYLPQDRMALTINGSTTWPTSKKLRILGEVRAHLSLKQIDIIFERIADAIATTQHDIRAYIREHSAFSDVGRSMLYHWEEGISHSLQ